MTTSGSAARAAMLTLTGLVFLGPTCAHCAPSGAGSQVRPLREPGALVFDSQPLAKFRFTGPVGDRIQGNIDNWLLCAPQANPGMLEMFRLRDRQPVPQLVPWAGEFVGKYLISAVQALRMSDNPRLFTQVSNVVSAFIATQAADGYLGPFPKDVRLLKHWDLWGHYHAIYALLLWHQHTGDPAALAAARKAADLVCRTYLGTGRRVFDAGDPEMNMAILTGMAMLYRATGEARYLEMVREVEKDWERAGDYLRTGLDGREFFQSPRPRWESLHDLQGLLELWRITGEAKYRESFIHHWRSIRRWDRRNTGGFSSGEQATGNPFAPTAIETCCTAAWMALTIDYLKLTGDPNAADELELSTLNAGLGAQHPSGRWWTYNTPMDGVREASAHSIVFQSRAGTPELNCCSVNGPRVAGMLSEWSAMSASNALVLNSYLPGEFVVAHSGQEVHLQLDRDYPRSDSQRVLVTKCGEREWTLRLRIPAWSPATRLEANFAPVSERPVAGAYLEIRRRWKAGDAVTLKFDFGLRAVPGAKEAAGKVSLYRGPLLLAWDQGANAFDADKIPAIELSRLRDAVVSIPTNSPLGIDTPAWLEVELPVGQETILRLVDFASAGAYGTPYRSWLPTTMPPPPPTFTLYPRDGERIRPGITPFQWRGAKGLTNLIYRVEISGDEAFSVILSATNLPNGYRADLNAAGNASAPGSNRWWRVITIEAQGATAAEVPAARYTLDPDAAVPMHPTANQVGPNGELILHSLRGGAPPKVGIVDSSKHELSNAEGTQINGRDQMVVYAIAAWPEEDFTVAVRVRIREMPKGRLGQIFCAWAAGMDDPLRLTVEGGKLFARIEAGKVYGTAGVQITEGAWHQVAAVKSGSTLRLFVDGHEAGSCAVPEFTATNSQKCALGGNPKFDGNEFLAATFAEFGLWERALSPAEIQRLASRAD